MTMNRCRHCRIKLDPPCDPCSVCGLSREKRRRDLSPAEREIRMRARVIRGIAMLHLAGGSLALLLIPCLPVHPAAGLILAAINLFLAFGLSRYAFRAHQAATVYYFLVGMVNIISVNLPGILLILILLYGIGNRRAKALFERSLV
jgi:hypothetical protein